MARKKKVKEIEVPVIEEEVLNELVEENNELVDENNEEILEENPIEIKDIEQKERPKFTIRPVKSFGKKINHQLVNEIVNNKEWLKQIAEMEYKVTSDDLLRSGALLMYQNVREITNEKDREIVEEMFLGGNEEILIQQGYDLFSSYVNTQEDMFYIFYEGEIVGNGRVFHVNKHCCDVNINVRGTPKIKASACNELIKFWGARHAKTLHNQGYKAAFAMTLIDKHAALIKKVAKREHDIILERLKLENPDRDVKELEARANKLSPGWKNVGAVLLRSYAGKIVKEHHWLYDLGQKFNEYIQ